MNGRLLICAPSALIVAAAAAAGLVTAFTAPPASQLLGTARLSTTGFSVGVPRGWAETPSASGTLAASPAKIGRCRSSAPGSDPTCTDTVAIQHGQLPSSLRHVSLKQLAHGIGPAQAGPLPGTPYTASHVVHRSFTVGRCPAVLAQWRVSQHGALLGLITQVALERTGPSVSEVSLVAVTLRGSHSAPIAALASALVSSIHCSA